MLITRASHGIRNDVSETHFIFRYMIDKIDGFWKVLDVDAVQKTRKENI